MTETDIPPLCRDPGLGPAAAIAGAAEEEAWPCTSCVTSFQTTSGIVLMRSGPGPAALCPVPAAGPAGRELPDRRRKAGIRIVPRAAIEAQAARKAAADLTGGPRSS
jgi:hypothetical protein